jgi:hypothetical protein
MAFRRRRRKSALEDAPDIVVRALAEAGLTDQARSLRIGRHWSAAVGPQIAARTQVQSYTRGVLTIKVASPAWQNELMYLKQDILTKLNKLVEKPGVRDLRVMGGHFKSAMRPASSKKVVRPPPSPQTVRAARRLAEHLPEGAGRDAFEKLLLAARVAEA